MHSRSKACHHLFCLPFEIPSPQSTWIYDSGSQLDSYRCETDSVKSFTTWILKSASGKRKEGGALSSIFAFSLCVIANDEKRRSNSSFITQNRHSWSPAERFISLFRVLAFKQNEKVIKQCKRFMLRYRSHNVCYPSAECLNLKMVWSGYTTRVSNLEKFFQ